MIFSISGRVGSGKDTVGKIIQDLTIPKPTRLKENEFGNMYREPDGSWAVHEEKSPFVIKKWATAVRKVGAILLGMDEQFLYTTEFKEMILPECWDIYTVRGNGPIVDHKEMTGRDFLQKLGTDAVRDRLHENTWVNALMSEYKTNTFTRFPEDLDIGESIIPYYPNWIITDTRFPNELIAVKERGALTIRVERNNGTRAIDINPHPSETALDNSDFDYTIENNGSIDDLVNMVKLILQKENILK